MTTGAIVAGSEFEVVSEADLEKSVQDAQKIDMRRLGHDEVDLDALPKRFTAADLFEELRLHFPNDQRVKRTRTGTIKTTKKEGIAIFKDALGATNGRYVFKRRRVQTERALFSPIIAPVTVDAPAEDEAEV